MESSFDFTFSTILDEIDCDMNIDDFFKDINIDNKPTTMPMPMPFPIDHNIFADITDITDIKDKFIPMQPTALQLPKYTGKVLSRGIGFDKFFEKPANDSMVDNATVMNTINFGDDQAVCSLPNLCCSGPTSPLKCEVAMESLMFVQATHILVTEYGVSSMADVYRHLSMLNDRKCVTCLPGKANGKIGCVSGSFQCVNCSNKGKMPFAVGFKAWLAEGSRARHAM
jgi:hypothetical protein